LRREKTAEGPIFFTDSCDLQANTNYIHFHTLLYDKSNPAFALIACSSFARITDSLVYCGSYDHRQSNLWH
jgi:hypothetical protein